MSRLQASRPDFASDLLNRLELPDQPRDLKLTRQEVMNPLLTLRARTGAESGAFEITVPARRPAKAGHETFRFPKGGLLVKRIVSALFMVVAFHIRSVAAHPQAATLAAQGEQISGVWVITSVTSLGERHYNRVTLRLQGERITGHSADMNLEGSLRGNALEIQARSSDGKIVGKFSGTIERGEMAGRGEVQGEQTAWTGRRPATRPANAPRLHTFVPQEFHRVFSSTIAPAMRIFPGDTVRTTTVDSSGKDAKLVARSLGGNPLTGPFYIEGALPGDTLVIHFNRIQPNRDSAESGSEVAASAVTPAYVSRVKSVENFDSTWKLDPGRGVAVLAHPTNALKDLKVPLRPMLGCVGVAPWGEQSFSSANLGPFGGNLDFSGVREGATLYLQVFQPGALLFVGDGHAEEGDGELTGDALETSMDVEFTVDIVEDKSTIMPRAEDDESWMALGIGGSLQTALEYATSGLADWLATEYNLNSAEVGVVLGTAIRYEVAELVDPQVHVVAKIDKRVLNQLHRATSGKYP